ncbi:MAG: hypothetical protein HXY18_02105 [Bryobacteraceae bacterium]|nr:hypothetical protein [Bryobacteraceae bacterium]
MAPSNISINPAPTAVPTIDQPAGHSTGPRPPEGKARSAQNARRRDFSAVPLQVLPSEQAEFDTDRNELLDQIKPATGLHAGRSLLRLVRCRPSHRRAYSRIFSEILKLQTHFMLWSATHADAQDRRDRDFPAANPAASRINARIARFSRRRRRLKRPAPPCESDPKPI